MKIKQLTFLILSGFVFMQCGSSSSSNNDDTSTENLFTLLTPEQTHIDFQNVIEEGLNTNVLMYEYFYNGGGVAVGDVNGDGYDDLYFTSNMQENRLYLNKKNMQFADITAQAGVGGRPGPWKTGTTMVDINADGKLDIYVCHSGNLRPEKKANELFINQEMIFRAFRFSKKKPLFMDSIALLQVRMPISLTLIKMATLMYFC